MSGALASEVGHRSSAVRQDDGVRCRWALNLNGAEPVALRDKDVRAAGFRQQDSGLGEES